MPEASSTGAVGDRFVDALLELDLAPAQLKAPPQTWLPAELWERAQTDPECAAALREYVETELEFASLSSEDGGSSPDPGVWFTARVVESLPAPEQGIHLRRRNWILAAFHALAIGVAYLVLLPLLNAGGADELFASVDAWVETDGGGGPGLGGFAVVTLAIAVTVVLVALPRPRTPATSA